MKGGSCGVPMPMLETFEDEPKPKAATASPPQLKVNDSVLSHSEKIINCDGLQPFLVFIYLIALIGASVSEPHTSESNWFFSYIII